MKGVIIDLKDITDSREVMESKESPKIRWFIYIVLLIIIIAVIFSCIFKIDEYSRITGEIVTSNASSTVVSTSACKLKEVYVTEGQSVEVGDLLFSLDADYAKEQKSILEAELENYESDLENTKLLKQCIEENTNLFDNDEDDYKYYYRYIQYENGVFLSAEEIENTRISNDSSTNEKESNLNSVEESIAQKNEELDEYYSLLECVKCSADYAGSNDVIIAGYNEYIVSLQKANLLLEQYQEEYEKLSAEYEEQSSTEKISYSDVERAKSEYETAYSEYTAFQESYLSTISSNILLLENQMQINPDEETYEELEKYVSLKSSLEQQIVFDTEDEELQNSYNQYIEQCATLNDAYLTKMDDYQTLYDEYTEQQASEVTLDTVNSAESAYNSAKLDVESIKLNYISQIQSTISSLLSEIDSLEESKQSIKLSLEDSQNLDEYEELSKEKLKSEAIVTINSEIDSLNSNITSIQTQLLEINETINNSEIKATVDGVVTLLETFNTGDIIQAGSSLCSIVPSDGSLEVKLYIPENEVSKLKVGQSTEYIFDAIPYNEYGKVSGTITSISADSITDESSGGRYFIAQAEISDTTLQNKEGDSREVKNGMLVETKVITGSKKVIIWLLEKINLID